jgi:hypothetical protein
MSPSGIESSSFAALTPIYSDSGMRALMPEWYFQAPYGQPRRIDIQEIRALAQSPWVHVCHKTIIDDFAATPWDVVPKDPKAFDPTHIDILKKFCETPNTNRETMPDLMRQWGKDILSVDAGVLVKVFDEQSYLADADENYKVSTAKATFVKNVNKEGFILPGSDNVGHMTRSAVIDISKEIVGNDGAVEKGFKPLKPQGSRNMIEVYCRDGSTFLADGDYVGFVHRWFQYSFKLPRRAPAVFDRDEISYCKLSPSSYSFYGWSPIQSLEDIIRTLKEAVLYTLTGLTEKGVPDGIISVLDISKVELERLKDYWEKDVKGKQHKFGVLGRDAKFTNLTVTARDMEMLSTQQWFVRLVMAMHNIDIPVLSLKGEAPKAGSLAILKRERAKAVLPLLQLWEQKWNGEVLSEFGFEDVEFKFQTYDLDEDKLKRDMDIADVNANILTINEVRTERGLDPVAYGDEPYNSMASALMTGGMPQTSMPKSISKAKPTLEGFRKALVLMEAVKDA